MNEAKLALKGALPYQYWVADEQNASLTDGGVIEESMLSIFINGQELATVMCSPLDQEALALGFAYNEGVIESLDEIGWIQANVTGTAVDIFLHQADFNPPRRMILTSGCGGGVTLQDLSATHPPLNSDLRLRPALILARMRDLQSSAALYQAVRGVHCSILADADGLLFSAEDVGRHNTLDKLAGKALQAGVSTQDKLILTSGRISSEMLGKARRLGVPIVASRTAPTSTSLALADAWGICVIGYVRRDNLRVYTQPWRLGL